MCCRWTLPPLAVFPLPVSAEINGAVAVNASIRLQIQQLSHKWYELCWTNLLSPETCPPTTVDVDVTLAVLKPSLTAKTQLNLVACAPGVATSA